MEFLLELLAEIADEVLSVVIPSVFKKKRNKRIGNQREKGGE